MKRILAALLISILALSAVFAGGSKEEDTSSALPEYKDTITIATASDQNYMDGQMNNTNDVHGWSDE